MGPNTHVVHWWSAEPERRSARAAAAVTGTDELVVADITWYELGWLATYERITITVPVPAWLQRIASEVRPPRPPRRSRRRPQRSRRPSPGDPADRLIYATAVEHGWALVTKDRRLVRFSDHRWRRRRRRRTHFRVEQAWHADDLGVFEAKQSELGGNAAVRGEPADRAGGGDDAVARDHDREGVAAQCLADGPCRAGGAEPVRDLAVGQRRARRDGAGDLVDPAVNGGNWSMSSTTWDSSLVWPCNAARMSVITRCTWAGGAGCSRASGTCRCIRARVRVSSASGSWTARMPRWLQPIAQRPIAVSKTAKLLVTTCIGATPHLPVQESQPEGHEALEHRWAARARRQWRRRERAVVDAPRLVVQPQCPHQLLPRRVGQPLGQVVDPAAVGDEQVRAHAAGEHPQLGVAVRTTAPAARSSRASS